MGIKQSKINSLVQRLLRFSERFPRTTLGDWSSNFIPIFWNLCSGTQASECELQFSKSLKKVLSLKVIQSELTCATLVKSFLTVSSHHTRGLIILRDFTDTS